MRFCLVTTFYPPFNFGGDGIFVRQLANALVQEGHEVEVVHCADSYALLARNVPSQPYQDDPRVTVHRLESGLGPLSPLATHQTGRPWLKGRRLRAILGRGFDVIHFHNISLVGGPKLLGMGVGSGGGAGAALRLYTLHEYWLLCPTHLLFRYDGVPCEERRCLRCQLHHGLPPQWWRTTGLLRRSLDAVDVLLAPSAFAARRHERELGRAVVHLPNFVPEEPDAGPALEVDERPARSCHAPDRAAPREGQPYVLYVGRLEPVKGAAALVRFFQHWRGARLLLAGAGREAESLERLARGLPHVELLGALSRERLRPLYRGALALVVPSRCYELCPLVVLEAFRDGAPVVVRDVGALPELVADGCGLVYRDDAELARHLERLAREPALGRALAQRARAAYERTWSRSAHLGRYFDIIEAARARRGAGSAGS